VKVLTCIAESCCEKRRSLGFAEMNNAEAHRWVHVVEDVAEFDHGSDRET
jgi:hypothetical protein